MYPDKSEKRKKKKNVTIEDIAKIANVSKATVSRSLNNLSSISTKTKDKINKIAEELGFRFNIHARNLAKNQSNRIAIVFPDDYLAFQTLDFFTGIEISLIREIDNNLYDMALLRVKDIKKAIETKLVDGFLIVSRSIGKKEAKIFTKYSIPFVSLLHINEGILGNFDFISSDNFSSGYQITEHFIKNGARNIITITSNKSIYTDYKFRTEGYIKALSDNNIPIKSANIIYSDMTFENAHTLVTKNIRAISNADAIFVQQDKIAIGIMNELKNMGISIPKDMLIAGHDDNEIIKYFAPSLTSYKQDYNLIAKKAIACLIKKIETQDDKSIIDEKIKGSLIVRESSSL